MKRFKSVIAIILACTITLTMTPSMVFAMKNLQTTDESADTQAVQEESQEQASESVDVAEDAAPAAEKGNKSLQTGTNGWNQIGTSDCQYKIETTGSGESQEVTLTIAPTNSASGTLPDDYGIKTAGDWPWYGEYGTTAKTITKVVINKGVKPGNSTARMFYYMSACTEIKGLTEDTFDTSNVKYMNYMFASCKKLGTIDISTFDISNVTNATAMFRDCEALKDIKWPVEINSSNIEAMGDIFVKTKIDAPKRKTYIKNLLEANEGKCKNWTVNLFNGCEDITIDVSDLDTSGNTSMTCMFQNCSKLKSIIGLDKLNTEKVETMDTMFRGCTSLTSLDLSNFDTSSLNKTNNMFNGCSNITTILVGSGWSMANVENENSSNMFKDCTSLMGGAGTTYDKDHTDATYARVDGGPESATPGYLTKLAQLNCTIVLKDGRAYANDASGMDITAAVADAGLKFVAAVPAGEGTEAVPAHWEMNNFTFTTSAARALEFADSGTTENPAGININVEGTNNITSGESSSTATAGMYFKDSNANVTISGSGAESSKLYVTGGKVTSEAMSYGLYSKAKSLTLKGLTAAFTSGTSTTNYGTNGVYANEGPFIVENGAKVTCAAQSTSGEDCGLSVYSLKVTGTGELVAVAGDRAVMTVTSDEPDARAVATGSPTTKLTWDRTNTTYKNGSNIATEATLTSAASITVGSQTGDLTYGTAGSATYDVALVGLDEPGSFDVAWFDKDGGSIDTPAGVETSYSKTDNKFTVSTTDATPAGTYKFTLKSGEVTSDKATLTVGKKALTVSGTTAQDKKYDGKTDATIEVGTVTGILVADKNKVTVKASGSFDDKDAGDTKQVNVTYSITGDAKDNYTAPNDESVEASINKRSVLLRSAAATKVYDGTPLTSENVTVDRDGFVTGEGATYNVTGSQTIAGSSNNTFTYTLNNGTNEDNYVIDTDEGTLTVEPIATPIVITAASASKKYDGTALTKNDGYTYTPEVLLSGDTLTAVVEGTITDAGSVDNKVTSYTVTNANREDVTGCYTFGTSVDGKLTVTKRSVTLTSASDSKTYDGTPLTNSNVAVSGDGFVAGEGATYNVTGSQTLKGSSENKFNYTLNDGTKAGNYNITKEEGTLTVNAITTPIVITAASASKKYDGTALTKTDGYTYTSDILKDGDVLTAVVEGTITDVGTGANTVKSYKVMRGETNVTDCYTFGTSVDGTLTVTKRSVKLTSASDSKTYDGTPLTNNTVTPSGDGWVDGEGATYTVTGSQTGVGESANSFTYELKSNTKAGNYEITTEIGTLTVNKITKAITITANSNSKAYDGTALTDDGFTFTKDIIVDGDTLTAKVEGTITDVGTKANTVKSYKVTNTAGDDVTSFYTFADSVDGTLEVTKRPITLTSASDCKLYDGTPLTSEKVTVSEGSFVEGESFAYNFNDGQTEVGTKLNRFTCVDDTAKVDNYDIAYVFGKLTVNATAKADKQVDTEALGRILDEYSDATKHPEYAGKDLSVKLDTDAEVPEKDKELIAAKAGGKKLVFNAAELYLIVDGEPVSIGDDNSELVAVTYKFDFTKKTDLQVFRAHTDNEGAKTVDEITETPNKAGEYVVYDKSAGTITVYASKYSTFAVAYNDVVDANTGDTNNSLVYALMLAISILGLAGYGLKRRDD